MSVAAVAIALLWGALSGYLLIRFIDNLAAAALCIGGLLKGKSGPKKDRVNPDLIVRLLFRVLLYALVCAILLFLGHSFVVREFEFQYSGIPLAVFAVAALAVAASRLKAMSRRLKVIRRMSHEPGYAEKRRRTQMLKG